MENFKNYNLDSIFLNKFKNESSVIKQYEFRNLSFCFNRWLSKRLLVHVVIFAIILKIQVTLKAIKKCKTVEIPN